MGLNNGFRVCVIGSHQVKNRGPDQIPSSEIVIQWPFEATSGKHLLYLIDVEVRLKCLFSFVTSLYSLSIEFDGDVNEDNALKTFLKVNFLNQDKKNELQAYAGFRQKLVSFSKNFGKVFSFVH